VGGFREVLGAANNGDPVLGRIVIVPTHRLYGQPQAPLSLAGLAPTNTSAVVGGTTPLNEGSQLPNPMHIVLPRPSYVKLKNTSVATTLLYSFGLGLPLESLGATEEIEIVGGVKELLLASADNAGGAAVAPSFNLTAVVKLGLGL
jgi:hypothetical protein